MRLFQILEQQVGALRRRTAHIETRRDTIVG